MDITHALGEGLALQKAGRAADAEAIYRQVLAEQPNHPDALHLLGLLAHARNDMPAAVAFLQRAIAVRPDIAPYHYNLGILFQRIGRLDDAIEAFQQTLARRPDHPEAALNLGNALAKRGRLDEAVAALQQGARVAPQNAAIQNSLGFAFQAQNRGDLAVAAFSRAIELDPKYAPAYSNLGLVLNDVGRIEDAIAIYHRAIAIAPNESSAHSNLGRALSDIGDIEQAVAEFRKAVELKPDDDEVHSNLLLSLHYRHGNDAEMMFAEHRRWAEMHTKNIPRRTHEKPREPDRRLRIGYISGDFREHSVSIFIEPILANHDRENFEIFCYSNSLRSDAITQRIKTLGHTWRNIAGVSNADAESMIAADGIDILVDLAGHTGEGRMMLMARKPAPIAVTWIGYPNTTGLEAIDYRITDVRADPPGSTEKFHTEQLLRLPNCFLCYQPSRESPDVAERSADTLTFGSFNMLPKISPAMIETWAKILREIPNSKLILKSSGLGNETARQRTRAAFAAHGIEENRLLLRGRYDSMRDHLELYNHIAIALDTFPYNGTTTTCEALWMGNPVITQAGQTHVTRVGASVLGAIGLENLVANSPDEYVSIALNLARDRTRLNELHRMLRQRMLNSPLLDAPKFTRDLESAYRTMWRNRCESE